MKIKRKYIFSYMFIVLAVIALTNSALIAVSISALRTTLEAEQMERGQSVAVDMDAQLENFLLIRNNIKTNYVFQPQYQHRAYTRRLELIKELAGYSSHLLPEAEVYFFNCSEDLIYFKNTCTDWATLSRLYWMIDENDPLRATLYEAMDNRVFTSEALDGDVLYALPFFMGYAAIREKMCLVFRVPCHAIEERLCRITHLDNGEFSVSYRGELLLGERMYDWKVLQSASGDFTIGLAGISMTHYERMSATQRSLLLLSSVFVVLSLAMAIYMALKQYQPIGFMVKQYGIPDQNQNELAQIERVISDALKENDQIKRDILQQMDSLRSQSLIIEQQTSKLQHQLVMLLLLGVYRSEEDLPAGMIEMFSHPKFAVLSIWGIAESMAGQIEKFSNAQYRLFAVPMAQKKFVAVLVNLDSAESLFTLVSTLGKALGSETLIFAGKVDDFSGISASFIQSTNCDDWSEGDSQEDLILGRDCQEMFQAIRMGNRDVATRRAHDFSVRVARQRFPLIELRRIYLVLLRKLENLATELECSISEQHAAALMVSLSPEDFEKNLACCVADLCEGNPLEAHSIKSLEVLNYIDEHVCEVDMSAQRIEDTFGMSRKKITSMIRGMTGMGFREYVVHQRIERAKMLLMNTKLPISAISELCGYESTSYFIKSFKSVTNKTPGQFQKDGEKSSNI